MRPDRRLAAAALLVLATLLPAHAFETLPAAQRQLLAPLAGAWPGLDPETRQRLKANAAHWQALDAGQRQALRQRMRDWDALPAPERASRRGPFAAWQALSLGEREQVRAAAARWAALDASQQQAVRDAFERLPSDRRQDWWLGPEIGAGFAQLRPLFAFVPADERQALLDLLRDLSPTARADLALLARRLPANQRETLRRELIAAPAAERDAIIRKRLEG